MLEDFFGALKNFQLHKLRTVLSLLGIIIGVMAVVVVTTLGTSLYGSLTKLLKDFDGSPMNSLEAYPQWSNELRKMAFTPDEKYRAGLYQASDKIKHVFYTSYGNGFVLRGSADTSEQNQNQSIIGVEPYYMEKMNIKLDTGTYFTLADYAERGQKAILPYDLAAVLFPEGNAVGKKFSIAFPARIRNGHSLPLIFYMKVVAVLPKNKTAAMIGRPEEIYVPRTFITALTHKDSVDCTKVVFRDEDDYFEVKDAIVNYSNSFAKSSDSVYIYSNKEQMSQMDKILGVVKLILSAIAFVSLFVGGINIMNIMTATVAERRKEIGIRKALGATNRRISAQFLTEAATLTLTGGIFGVLIGFLVSYLVISFIPDTAFTGDLPMKMQFIIDREGTAIAFFVSVAVGIIFGLRPALKASRMDPIKALV